MNRLIMPVMMLFLAFACAEDDVSRLCIGYCGEQKSDKVHYLFENNTDQEIDLIKVKSNIEERDLTFEGQGRTCFFYAGGEDFKPALADIQDVTILIGNQEISGSEDIPLAQGVEYEKSAEYYYIISIEEIKDGKAELIISGRAAFECNDTPNG